MVRSAEFSFEYLNYAHRNDSPLSKKLSTLAGVPTLYLQALDDPELSDATREMFLKAPEPREQAIMPHGNFVSMNDDEKRTYENRVVTFFLARLPAVGKPIR
jgi:hypothetical protein